MIERFVYSRWDERFSELILDEESILDALYDQILENGNVDRSLRNLMQNGLRFPDGTDARGLRQMIDQVRKRKDQKLNPYEMDEVKESLNEKLNEILDQELSTINQQQQTHENNDNLDENNLRSSDSIELQKDHLAQRQEFLNNLPQKISGKIDELSKYDFLDEMASEAFQKLLKALEDFQKKLMDLFQQKMMENPQSSEADDSSPQGNGNDDVSNEYGTGNISIDSSQPGSPDQQGSISETLSNMSRLSSIMTSSQWQQLVDIIAAVFGQDSSQALQETANLTQRSSGDYFPFQTELQNIDPLREIELLQAIENELQSALESGSLDDLDFETIERIMGIEFKDDLRNLDEIASLLEKLGYAQLVDGELKLTPRGIRKIAQNSLKDVFGKMNRDGFGSHDLLEHGRIGEVSDYTKPFTFGETLDLDVSKTLRNAVYRDHSSIPIKLIPDDFEVIQREDSVKSATVILIDQSRSMGYFGSFKAAKKATLALSALIRGMFPRDLIHVIGFSDYAIEINESDIPLLSWNYSTSGTNMHHAFMLARKLLNKHKGSNKQILMITDGEPTSHLEGSYSFFDYPPHPKTIRETLNQVNLCTRERITINTFMLEASQYLINFVEKLTKMNHGRAFYTTPDKLGEYLVVDFVKNRRSHIN